MRGDGAIRGEKTLCVSRGLESPHAALARAGRLVRSLGVVVQIPALPMFPTGQDRAHGRPIAFQSIRDAHPRHIGQPLHELAEESLRRLLVPLALHQDSEDLAVLIDGPPEVVALARDGQNYLIQMPLVTRSGASMPSWTYGREAATGPHLSLQSA